MRVFIEFTTDLILTVVGIDRVSRVLAKGSDNTGQSRSGVSEWAIQRTTQVFRA
jgi:hypothetical protein